MRRPKSKERAHAEEIGEFAKKMEYEIDRIIDEDQTSSHTIPLHTDPDRGQPAFRNFLCEDISISDAEEALQLVVPKYKEYWSAKIETIDSQNIESKLGESFINEHSRHIHRDLFLKILILDPIT